MQFPQYAQSGPYPYTRPSLPVQQQPMSTSYTPAYPPAWVHPVAGPSQPYQQYSHYNAPYPSYNSHASSHTGDDRQRPPAGPSRGRDYLLSLQTDMTNLQLYSIQPRQRTISSPSPGKDKPLPRLPPPPPLPSRPYTVTTTSDIQNVSAPSKASPHVNRPFPAAQTGLDDYLLPARPRSSPPKSSITPQTIHHSISTPSNLTVPPLPTPPQVQLPSLSTPPKSFRPSINLLPASEPRTSRPCSDPSVPRISRPKKGVKGKKKITGTARDPIYIDDSDVSSDDSAPLIRITTRSPARRKRATSEVPRSAATVPSPKVSGAVKCAGFTRKGQPCQRLVKSQAPYLSRLDDNLPEDERVSARYCKDHAGMICNTEGFYWRGTRETAGIWIQFEEFIPAELGQQTQALLRMTMESPLTDKEAPGYLYAYELRDLQNENASFFKVGRTDNVPRRIGEWTTRCRSHTPTLRDIFPVPGLSPSKTKHASGTSLDRNPSLPPSFIPGAFRQSTNPSRTCPAVKRWERLVHLELADRAWSDVPKEYERLKEKCNECQAVHKEIFPLANQDRLYEDVVREAICRWERFVRRISSG